MFIIKKAKRKPSINLIKYIKLFSVIGSCLIFSSKTYSDDLLTVYQKAATKDPILQQAIADYEATKQNLPIALADLLPSLVLQAGISYNKIHHFPPNPNVNSKYFALNLSQSLFEWDKISRLLQSNLEVEKAVHDLEVAKQDLLVRVSNAYFDILQAEDNLYFITTEKDSVKKLYDQAKEKFEVGFIAIADVEESNARYQVTVSDEIQAKNNVANRYEILRQIINENIKDIYVLTPKFKPTTPRPDQVEKWVEMALRRNHSLIAQQLEYQIKQKDEDIAFAGYLPNAKINGRYTGRNSSKTVQISDVRNTKGYLNSYGWDITGNWNLFAGGGTYARVDQAKYFAIAEGFNTDRLSRQVISDTRQSYRNIITSLNQIIALEQAVKSAISALDATKAGYELGTRASIDVLNSLTDLYDQKQKLSIARYEYIKNVIKLKQNSGILSNQDMSIVNDWLVNKSIRAKNLDKTDVRDSVLDDINNTENKNAKEIKKENQNPYSYKYKPLIDKNKLMGKKPAESLPKSNPIVKPVDKPIDKPIVNPVNTPDVDKKNIPKQIEKPIEKPVDNSISNSIDKTSLNTEDTQKIEQAENISNNQETIQELEEKLKQIIANYKKNNETKK